MYAVYAHTWRLTNQIRSTSISTINWITQKYKSRWFWNIYKTCTHVDNYLSYTNIVFLIIYKLKMLSHPSCSKFNIFLSRSFRGILHT